MKSVRGPFKMDFLLSTEALRASRLCNVYIFCRFSSMSSYSVLALFLHISIHLLILKLHHYKRILYVIKWLRDILDGNTEYCLLVQVFLVPLIKFHLCLCIVNLSYFNICSDNVWMDSLLFVLSSPRQAELWLQCNNVLLPF